MKYILITLTALAVKFVDLPYWQIIVIISVFVWILEQIKYCGEDK